MSESEKVSEEKGYVVLSIDRRQIIDFITGIDVIVMKNGTTRKITGIPGEVKLEQVYLGSTHDSIEFILSHPSFPKLPSGGAVARPLITATDYYSRHLHYHLAEEDSGL